MCKCGCNTCETKPITMMLNESIAPRAILSEGLEYHLNNGKPLTEQLYRAGSSSYFNLWAEARALYSRGIIEVYGDDKEIITETHLGEFGILYEIEIGDRVKASKEYGGLSGEVVDIRGSFVVVKTKEGNQSYHESDLQVLNKEGKKVPLDFPMEETIEKNKQYYKNIAFLDKKGLAKKQFSDEDIQKAKKMLSQGEFKLDEAKNKPIGKPMRDSSGGKAYKVYVRDPKTKKIKTVRFGSGGLKAKINNPKARQAFAKRHNCAQKKDKTKASYWSCRLPRYAKLLGLKSNFTGFW
jgi:hypothetical protein